MNDEITDLPEQQAATKVSTRPPKKTSFLGDVARMAFGTAFAQVLSVLALPFLARLYSPAAFGIWGIFISATTIFNVISNLRYEPAIVLPEAEEDSANILSVSIMFAFLISALILPMVLFGKEMIAGLLNAPDLASYLWLLPFNILVVGLLAPLNFWCVRKKQFARVSVIQVVNQLVTLGLKVGFGFLGFKRGGLIVGDFLGNAAAALVLVAWVFREDIGLFLSSIRWPRMVAMISRYRRFPIYNAWSSLLNAISWQVPAFMLSSYFSTTVSGNYSFGNKVIQNPMSVIATAIGRVFFQRSTEAKANGTLADLVESSFRQLLALGLFPLLVFMVIGRDLFVIVFTAKYADAGVYSQILSIWIFFWFISAPLSDIFLTLEHQDVALRINIAIFITRLLSLMIGGYFHNVYLALYLFSITGVITYGYLSFKTMSVARVPMARVFKILLENIALFVPAGLILGVMVWQHLNGYLIVGVAIVLTGIYYVYRLFTDPQLMALMRKVIGQPRVSKGA